MDHTPHRFFCAHADLGLTRRDVLNGALLLGAAGLVAGCQSQQKVSRLPEPVWPEVERRAPDPPPEHASHASAPSGLPQGVIPRTEWTKSTPNFASGRPKPMNGVRRITVHHSAVNSADLVSKADTARQLEAFRSNHVSRTDGETGLHWVDIGYHYIIDPSGRVWEGRPITIEGAHVSHTNQHNLGVMLMGNFDVQRPSRAALEALDNFVAGQMKRHKVNIASVFTHQELKSTECPGRNLQRYMLQTRASTGNMARLALA